MRIAAIKKMRGFRWQMKFRPWTISLEWWRAIFRHLFGRRAIKRLLFRILPTWRRAVQRICQNTKSPVQLIINLAELAVAFQLICGYAKTGEHDDENQAIPDLQTPLDGFENFHSMQ